MEQREQDRRWFNREPIEGVRYELNDCVNVTGGEYSGQGGAVISLLSVSPVTYLVELGSGDGDVEVAESDLQLIEKHSQDQVDL